MPSRMPSHPGSTPLPLPARTGWPHLLPSAAARWLRTRVSHIRSSSALCTAARLSMRSPCRALRSASSTGAPCQGAAKEGSWG